ncbi:MAG: hypothetical protein HY806_09955 [Nitrospirae bacterium]|nr:hypothetical protein [Nitrospirota bacterium]
MKKSFINLAVLFIAVLISTGCATFRGNEVPRAEMPKAPNGQDKPAVHLDVAVYKLYTDLGALPSKTTDKRFNSMVKYVTTESSIFGKYTFDSSTAKKIDYTLQIDFTRTSNRFAARIGKFFTGITLGIIPTWANYKYHLTAKVLNSEGNAIKSYTLDDHATRVHHLAMFFIGPFFRYSKISETVEVNMLKNLYQQIISDNILYASKDN